VAALATTAALGAASFAFATGSGTASAQIDPASRAIEYLQTQQSASDGSIPVGSSTATVSEEYAIGAAAAGYDPKALRQGTGPSVMTYLAAHAASACAAAGACGELIQAVVAAGLDPGSFGGVDLLTSLAHFYNSSSGAFSDGSAFTQALAVQGLVAASQPVPAGAINLLVVGQDSDGGWGYLLTKDDPNAPSDTNSTAMVLMALDATGTHSRDVAALTWLHTQQDSDGGFPYQAGFGTDPDSTALVLQALLASGQNPNAPAWTVAGHSPLAELIATQDRNGGFHYPGNPTDPFTTAQVPPALARTGYPLTCGATCFKPGTVLAGPSPSPTPVPTATPRPTAAGVVTLAPRATAAAPAPTASVQGVTATPTPAPPTPTSAPSAGAPSVAGPGGPTPSHPIATAGFPVVAVYLFAAAGAAILVGAVAVGVRRRGGV
jgi:hypothetical protein